MAAIVVRFHTEVKQNVRRRASVLIAGGCVTNSLSAKQRIQWQA